MNAAASAFDQDVAGNTNVGALDLEWFASLGGADLHLTPVGDATFSGIAVWMSGDPPFDIEGDLRPNTDGAMDYAGADVS